MQQYTRESIHELVERNKEDIYRLALMYCKNQADADDIFQEVFLGYCKADPVFGDKGIEKAWFFRETVNCCKDLLCSTWFQQTSALDETIPAMTGKERELYEYIRELPPNYRIVVYLHFYQGYSLVKVAELMGKNKNTIRTYLFRARKQLRNVLEKEEFMWNVR